MTILVSNKSIENLAENVDYFVIIYSFFLTIVICFGVHLCQKLKLYKTSQTVRTAGAHVNGDEGSVMVFTDDDEFICPNCMMNTPAEKDTCNLSILIIQLLTAKNVF
jgi:hypothetical protein